MNVQHAIRPAHTHTYKDAVVHELCAQSVHKQDAETTTSHRAVQCIQQHKVGCWMHCITAVDMEECHELHQQQRTAISEDAHSSNRALLRPLSSPSYAAGKRCSNVILVRLKRCYKGRRGQWVTLPHPPSRAHDPATLSFSLKTALNGTRWKQSSTRSGCNADTQRPPSDTRRMLRPLS